MRLVTAGALLLVVSEHGDGLRDLHNFSLFILCLPGFFCLPRITFIYFNHFLIYCSIFFLNKNLHF